MNRRLEYCTCAAWKTTSPCVNKSILMTLSEHKDNTNYRLHRQTASCLMPLLYGIMCQWLHRSGVVLFSNASVLQFLFLHHSVRYAILTPVSHHKHALHFSVTARVFTLEAFVQRYSSGSKATYVFTKATINLFLHIPLLVKTH